MNPLVYPLVCVLPWFPTITSSIRTTILTTIFLIIKIVLYSDFILLVCLNPIF